MFYWIYDIPMLAAVGMVAAFVYCHLLGRDHHFHDPWLKLASIGNRASMSWWATSCNILALSTACCLAFWQ